MPTNTSVKPFNIGILKATVDNLLTNRALLRSKYANLELDDEEEDDECINCSQDIDWKFIANVKKHIKDNIDNPALTVDVLMQPGRHEPYKFLQQTQGIDRPGSGRLYPV